MKNRRFDEIPTELRDGWEPTTAGAAWVELLGPHVPEDVKRWSPNTDSGFLLSDPHLLLEAENTFADVLDRSISEGVFAPTYQVMTNTYYLAEVPHEGDCLMFFSPRGSETAEVVAWSHETNEFYGPVAHDLPTMTRLIEVTESSDDVDKRRAALAPALGRWQLDEFPISLFERNLADDGVWNRDDAWPEVEAPKSIYARVVARAWWVAKALVGGGLEREAIEAQLEESPAEAFGKEDFQDLPYSALYWLWRSYLLGEDEWHATALERCKDSRSRLVRDAALHAEAQVATPKSNLALWRDRAIETVEKIRNPFPQRIQVGALALERDDSLASLEPVSVDTPSFRCAPDQPLKPFWPKKARVAIPHPDGKRWLVEGSRERQGSRVDGLFEVDPDTGIGTMFAETRGEVPYTKWGEYIDENLVVVINNGRLRLYQREPAGDGRGHLLDEIQLRQERAIVMRDIGLIVGYGGVPRFLDNGWQTQPECLACARLIDGRLKQTATIDIALAHVEEKDGALLGRDVGKTVGYRLDGLAATPAVDRITLVPTHFVTPEKIWRAGPSAVLDSLGPSDVSLESPRGLCMINRAVTDPAGARRAYVGDSDGIRPTDPELDTIGYVLISDTIGCFVGKTEAHRVDLKSGQATKLFDHLEGASMWVLQSGFIILEAGELVARSLAGDELARIKAGDGAALLTPVGGSTVLAMKTAASPLVLITIHESKFQLLGAVNPDGDLADLRVERHAIPQWNYRLIAKTPEGTRLGLRGFDAALTNPAVGTFLETELPQRPWELEPLTR